MRNKYDLIIVRDDAIGDYILWHDTFIAYSKRFKGKKVLLICDDKLKELAKNEELFSQVLCYNRKEMMNSLTYKLSFSKQLLSLETDLLLYPAWTQHVIGDVFVFFIRAEVKIGMVGNKGDNYSSWKTIVRKLSYRMFDKLIPPPAIANEIKVIEHFTREVIQPSFTYGLHPLKVRHISFNLPEKYMVLSLSASNKYRVWDMKNFAQVINHIPNDYSVVLSGVGNDDVERAKIIKQNVDDPSRLIDMVNKTSVVEMVSLISMASFVLGNDSAAVHIAAATRVPSICAFHGAHFNRFLPYPDDMPQPYYSPRAVYVKMNCYGCCYQCDKPIEGSYYCLRQVTPEMVIKELNIMLKEMKEKES